MAIHQLQVIHSKIKKRKAWANSRVIPMCCMKTKPLMAISGQWTFPAWIFLKMRIGDLARSQNSRGDMALIKKVSRWVT